ncbi:hypothetical protein Sfulv_18960 [Streptomyces fulvorobeus]|uniref:SSD domain-containing protein n=1 Tax=Streptomyces fulvorobeus TaxID=284028 RepID=A0A7J0C3J3_9ACTN|nr:hypothetical protein Sfulv_18960 [Streptomyces fulvorobeus]
MRPGVRRALPWLVVAFWVALIAVAAPFAGKLGDVQRDRAVDYLPADADSTQVAKIQDTLPGGESTDLVLVYHRDSGLTPADRAEADEQTASIAGAHELSAVPRGVPSQDGTTLMYAISSTEPGQDEDVRAVFVGEIRETAKGGDGLRVEVGGPGALNVDALEVYGSLGGPLLYTTVAVVAILLILIYRSPFLWLVPLVVAGMADFLSMAVAYGLNQGFDITISGQSAGVMTILVFGAGTDYALLVVARYREELSRFTQPYDAMAAALRGCGPAVVASSGTVAAGLLCLLAANLNSSRGMGPIAAVGVLCALFAMMTLLPAVLVLLGRHVFWPIVPRTGACRSSAVRCSPRWAAPPGAGPSPCSSPAVSCWARCPSAPSPCPVTSSSRTSSPARRTRSVPWRRSAAPTPTAGPSRSPSSRPPAGRTRLSPRSAAPKGSSPSNAAAAAAAGPRSPSSPSTGPSRPGSGPPSRPCAPCPAATSADPAPSSWTWSRPTPVT